MGIESGPKKKVLSAEKQAALQAEWEKRLASEGLGEDNEQTSNARTEEDEIIENARNRARLFYMETPRKQWDMHKAEMIEIQNYLRTAGVDPEIFGDDIMKSTEDEMVSLLQVAHEAYRSIIAETPMLEHRPKILEKRIAAHLQEHFPHYKKKIIESAARSFKIQ